VQSMPKSIGEDIYRKHYATPLRYDDLPAGLDYTVLDLGINSGIGRAGKMLRQLLVLPTDTSLIDDAVLAAIKLHDINALIIDLNDARLAYLKALRTWPIFGNGWSRRVAGVKAASLNLATRAAQTTQQKPAEPANPKLDDGSVVAAVLRWFGLKA